MIKINGQAVDVSHFPDGTLLMKQKYPYTTQAYITWFFENNEELVALIYLTNHLRTHGMAKIILYMPYVPNARQDRVKESQDVFTLKYFADIINYLNFDYVKVLDPHSAVSEALIDNIVVASPKLCINDSITKCNPSMLFFPDEGSMKRDANMASMP